MSKMAGIYSVSCPDLTVNHEWTIKKLNSVYKTKSLPNMPLFYDESEMKNIDTKTTGVSITFEIEEHDKKLSASCPNLTQNHELTVKKFNSDNKTKSLPNMVYSDELKVKKAYDSKKITEIECASQEEIEVPKKKRRTIYKRVKRSNFYEICLNLENLQLQRKLIVEKVLCLFEF
ncbi:hypothetical protein AGLY_001344 [Aphis glycines]|uniref:Uncharacterized protein n=1 Tax=Aphis glycines TaxID=307491 RepID=A0A6G0U4X2_APHGL|nr:hypothetical protein AGLY_001344 [Aphis glycines]